jgi:hypothetical protein
MRADAIRLDARPAPEKAQRGGATLHRSFASKCHSDRLRGEDDVGSITRRCGTVYDGNSMYPPWLLPLGLR